MACLLAAQGMDQDFKHEPWLTEWEMDWGSKGLHYEPEPVPKPPQKPSKLGQLFGYFLVLGVAGIFVLGLVTIVRFFANVFRH